IDPTKSASRTDSSSGEDRFAVANNLIRRRNKTRTRRVHWCALLRVGRSCRERLQTCPVRGGRRSDISRANSGLANGIPKSADRFFQKKETEPCNLHCRELGPAISRARARFRLSLSLLVRPFVSRTHYKGAFPARSLRKY